MSTPTPPVVTQARVTLTVTFLLNESTKELIQDVDDAQRVKNSMEEITKDRVLAWFTKECNAQVVVTATLS